MFDQLKEEIDLIIFSDFNYGCLPLKSLVNYISEYCKKNKDSFFADSQSSSQFGDISRFRDATIICATERETRLALTDYKSGLQNLTNNLLLKTKAENLMLKLGSDGIIIAENNVFLTDSLSSLNPNPSDVAGAGDAFLAAISLYYSCSKNLWESALVGSLASGVQVSRPGNVPIYLDELLSQVDQMFQNRF